jgi:putative transposase
VAARRAWGFAELEQLRSQHDLTIRRYCAIVGMAERTYYDRRARHHAGQSVRRGPWPTPAQDRVSERVIEMALAFPMWGHRKIAWLCRHDGLDVSDATCLRVLRTAGLVLPVDYVRERRDLATARREAFVTIPTRRNRVWQTDFFELETSGGGTWRSGDVIDYVTKLVLAGPVTATQTATDAINSIEDARAQVHDLLGHSLLDDITCPITGQITPVIVVSDNGPCYKGGRFASYIHSRPELTHVRTRRRTPQTNGVIERYHGAIQIEHLWRQLPADGVEMTTMVEDYRQLYNTIRPHETLAGARPIERYLADPLDETNATPETEENVRIT